MTMLGSTTTTIDRAAFTIAFQRTFLAPCEDVFDAWTQPEQLTAWWDPTGAPLASCTVDLRPGGRFRFVNDSAHGPPFEGVYQVVERPSLLVFEALGAIGTVRLARAGDATHMNVTIRCANAQHFEQFVQMGVHLGTERTLDNLVAHMAKKPR